MRDGAAIVSALGGRRMRNGWKFRCPAHADPAPSCVMRDDGLITCFAGCPRSAVHARLDELGFPDDGTRRTHADPEELARYRAEGMVLAQQMWDDALRSEADIQIVEQYLRRRKITCEVPWVMRRHGLNGYICCVQDLSGVITGVQIKSPGRKGVTHGWLGEGAVQLGPPKNGELGLAEGLENALSATQLTGIPCWAVLGSKRLAFIELPRGVRKVTLFRDNDEPGRKAADQALEAYSNRRVACEDWPPVPEFNDWNDALMNKKMEQTVNSSHGG